VLIHRLDFHKTMLRESISAGRPVVEQTMTGLGQMIGQTPGIQSDGLAAVKQIYLLMTREATVLAFMDSFFILALCFFAMLLTLPLVRKPKMQAASAEAH